MLSRVPDRRRLGWHLLLPLLTVALVLSGIAAATMPVEMAGRHLAVSSFDPTAKAVAALGNHCGEAPSGPEHDGPHCAACSLAAAGPLPGAADLGLPTTLRRPPSAGAPTRTGKAVSFGLPPCRAPPFLT